MRAVRVSCVVIAIALTGCASRVNPSWVTDRDLDLPNRKAFSVARPQGPPNELEANDRRLWIERRDLVTGLIRNDLISKGYHVTETNPEIVMHFRVGSGPKGMNTYFENERLGELDIRAADPTSGKWLWHAWATETVTDRLDAREEISEAVPLLLSNFPPAS